MNNSIYSQGLWKSLARSWLMRQFARRDCRCVPCASRSEGEPQPPACSGGASTTSVGTTKTLKVSCATGASQILVREHRGGFIESMSTIREIEPTKEAVARWVSIVQPVAMFRADTFEPIRRGVSVEDIRVEYYGWDERCNWDTWIILLDGIPFGFSNGPMKS